MRHTSTTSCDVLWNIITEYKARFGANFDQVPIGIGPNNEFLLCGLVRGAKNGCEAHRMLGEFDACQCYSCDEQLKFVSPAGIALSNTRYRLTVGNGELVEGITDDQGRTTRVRTADSTPIKKVEFFGQPDDGICCSRAYRDDTAPLITRYLADIKTSEDEYGTSVKSVTVQSKARKLTDGEIKMVWPIFKDSIDYSKVLVHNEHFLPFGLQSKDVAMTPNGEMYFDESHFADDFSELDIQMQKWFIHEMVHVWQYHLGYPVLLRGAVRLGLSYEYTLDDQLRLSDYNMEAQGNLLADYFALKYRSAPDALYEVKYATHPKALELYEAVLRNFLADPKSKSNLP